MGNEDIEQYGEKLQGEKCPECKSDKFKVYKQHNETVGECLACGYCETT